MHDPDIARTIGYDKFRFLVDTGLATKEMVELAAKRKAEAVPKETREKALDAKNAKKLDTTEREKREKAYNKANKAYKAAQLETLEAEAVLNQTILAYELLAFPIDDYAKKSQQDIQDELTKLFPNNTFGPSSLGPGKVSVNGKFDVDARALRRMPPSDREILLHGLSDAAKPDEHTAMVKEMSKSGGLRLRFPEHATKGKNFLMGLGLDPTLQGQVAALYGTPTNPAAATHQNRAFDICNKSGLDRDLAKRAVEFALKIGVSDLSELVDNFDFYEKTCAMEVTKKVQEMVDGGDTRNKKVIEKEVKKKMKERHAAKGEMPSHEFDRVKKEFDSYKTAVTSTGVGTSAVSVAQHATSFDANRGVLVGAATKLCFGKVSTAAYHTFKHYDELHASEQLTGAGKNTYEDQVLSYHTGARKAVGTGKYGGGAVTQGGGEKHRFKGPVCTAIVWMSGGSAGLATYFSI